MQYIKTLKSFVLIPFYWLKILYWAAWQILHRLVG